MTWRSAFVLLAAPRSRRLARRAGRCRASAARARRARSPSRRFSRASARSTTNASAQVADRRGQRAGAGRTAAARRRRRSPAAAACAARPSAARRPLAHGLRRDQQHQQRPARDAERRRSADRARPPPAPGRPAAASVSGGRLPRRLASSAERRRRRGRAASAYEPFSQSGEPRRERPQQRHAASARRRGRAALGRRASARGCREPDRRVARGSAMSGRASPQRRMIPSVPGLPRRKRWTRPAQRAIADYDALLRDESACAQELEERFLERMRERQPHLRRAACCARSRGRTWCRRPCTRRSAPPAAASSAPSRRPSARSGRALWDRVGLRPEERELVAIDPGFRRSVAARAARLVPDALELPVRRAQRRDAGRRLLRRGPRRGCSSSSRCVQPLPGALAAAALPHTGDGCSRRCSRCYREAGGREQQPDDRRRRLRGRADARRAPHGAPRVLRVARLPLASSATRASSIYERGRLRHEGRAIDIVYKRLLVNELLERARGARRAADRRRARRRGGDRQPVPLQAHPQEGDLRGAHRRRAAGRLQRRASARRSARTCRGRGASPRDARLRYGDEIDLPRFVLDATASGWC